MAPPPVGFARTVGRAAASGQAVVVELVGVDGAEVLVPALAGEVEVAPEDALDLEQVALSAAELGPVVAGDLQVELVQGEDVEQMAHERGHRAGGQAGTGDDGGEHG